MKRSLSELVFADCIFILFLSLCNLVSGVTASVLYAMAFILPVILITFIWKTEKREVFEISVSASPDALKLCGMTAMPIILAVMLIAFLTGLFMSLFGIESQGSDYGENLLYAIIVSALAPAIFEEMLFRYLPIRALGKHSLRLAVIYSAVLFSLAHCNLFQIPYALFAGILFAALDAATGSVLPSILIHFLNNLFSIFWETYGTSVVFLVAFLSSIFVLAALSCALIFVKREKVKNAFLPIITDKSKVEFTYPLAIYIVVMLIGATAILVF